jgi:hypothetical protein
MAIAPKTRLLILILAGSLGAVRAAFSVEPSCCGPITEQGRRLLACSMA